MAPTLLNVPGMTISAHIRLLAGVSLLIACNDVPDRIPEHIPAPAPDHEEAALCDDANPGHALLTVPGVSGATEHDCGDYVIGPARCFSLTIPQLIDHTNPADDSFNNRLMLIHRSCDAPTVMDTNGYANYDVFYNGELGDLFQTNWIQLEHRYQGWSAPAARHERWDGLTIANAAADAHNVIETLKQFYDGKWVTTGASKGGITAVYHSFFYPDDVDGVIPYVAPASIAKRDVRYQDYLDGIGPESCRNALRDYQVAALTDRRSMIIERLLADFPVSPDDASRGLDMMTASMDWGFWQYTGVSACNSIPPTDASDDDFWSFFSDMNLDARAPALLPAVANAEPDWELDRAALMFEWLTEHGFALQVGSHVVDYFVHRPDSMEESFIQYTLNPLPAHDPSITLAASEWVAEAAENMIFIYGSYDPWTGGMLPSPAHPSSARFFAPGVGHWASLFDLDPLERPDALAMVEGIMGRPANLELEREAAASERIRRSLLSRDELAAASSALLIR